MQDKFRARGTVAGFWDDYRGRPGPPSTKLNDPYEDITAM